MPEPAWKNKLLPVLPVLFALAAWQCFVQFSHSELLPSPLSSLKALCDLATSNILFEDCLASLKRVFIGFCLAAVLGIATGLATGLFVRLRLGLLPLIELLRPIPPIAWIPIAITFFGIGDSSSCFVIFIGAFYPIFTNTLLGVREVPALYIDAAKMLGASKARIYQQVIVPCALPSIFAGLRVGLGFAWACVVAAEMIAAHSGLGYEIQLNRQLLQLDRVVAGMAVIGFIGVTMGLIMECLEQKLLPWRKIKGRSASEQIIDEENLPGANQQSILDSIDNLTGASIVLDKVNFKYNQSKPILENVSLTLKEGEFHCLIGPSGCGKTSLLRLIAGLYLPTSGRITVNGGNVIEHKSEITMVFQTGALFPWLTALENVAFALQSQGLSKTASTAQAKTFLEVVGLTNRSCSYPSQLSGGQQQRVALARALAYRPRLILMDEPFSALDSQTRELLQQDVANLLSKMGVSVILVTHDIREAVFMAEKVYVMSKNGGRIVEELTIDTPRPERDDAFRYSAEFSSARAALWHALHNKTNDTVSTSAISLEV